jgi:hypothetical protein
MMMRLRLGSTVHALLVSIASRSSACPDCVTGRTARASVFGPDFTENLLLITAPLIVLTSIVILLHRMDVEPRPRRRGDGAKEAG